MSVRYLVKSDFSPTRKHIFRKYSVVRQERISAPVTFFETRVKIKYTTISRHFTFRAATRTAKLLDSQAGNSQ